MELLTPEWPEVVSFGAPFSEYLLESTVPTELRDKIVDSLHRAVDLVKNSNIESGQQHTAINALTSIASRLQTQPWNADCHQQWRNFVQSMDQVKGIAAGDYCSTLDKLLTYQAS